MSQIEWAEILPSDAEKKMEIFAWRMEEARRQETIRTQPISPPEGEAGMPERFGVPAMLNDDGDNCRNGGNANRIAGGGMASQSMAQQPHGAEDDRRDDRRNECGSTSRIENQWDGDGRSDRGQGDPAPMFAVAGAGAQRGRYDA